MSKYLLLQILDKGATQAPWFKLLDVETRTVRELKAHPTQNLAGLFPGLLVNLNKEGQLESSEEGAFCEHGYQFNSMTPENWDKFLTIEGKWNSKGLVTRGVVSKTFPGILVLPKLETCLFKPADMPADYEGPVFYWVEPDGNARVQACADYYWIEAIKRTAQGLEVRLVSHEDSVWGGEEQPAESQVQLKFDEIEFLQKYGIGVLSASLIGASCTREGKPLPYPKHPVPHPELQLEGTGYLNPAFCSHIYQPEDDSVTSILTLAWEAFQNEV